MPSGDFDNEDYDDIDIQEEYRKNQRTKKMLAFLGGTVFVVIMIVFLSSFSGMSLYELISWLIQQAQ